MQWTNPSAESLRCVILQVQATACPLFFFSLSLFVRLCFRPETLVFLCSLSLDKCLTSSDTGVKNIDGALRKSNAPNRETRKAGADKERRESSQHDDYNLLPVCHACVWISFLLCRLHGRCLLFFLCAVIKKNMKTGSE